MSLSFLDNPRVRFLMDTLETHGHQALVVGGAARDGLRGIPPKDIDLATDAHPDRVSEIFSQFSDVAPYPTGIEHGTWTAVVDTMPMEITTFRRDVSTDGRRASVAYAERFDIDAMRRDFTINALGLDRHGTIHDPTQQGLTDLKTGTVRFVGVARDRCNEDALRVLRLFRFQGRMGTWPMDTEALDAARHTALSHISGERIWSEFKGIMETPPVLRVVEAMKTTGIWDRILPNTPLSPARLSQTLAHEQAAGLDPHWARRLYALTGRNKLPYPMSGSEARRLVLLDRHAKNSDSVAVVAAKTKSAAIAQDIWTLTGKGDATQMMLDAQWGERASLPLTGKDLLAAGHKPGPKMGQTLDWIRTQWYASDLTLTKSQLTQLLPSQTTERER